MQSYVVGFLFDTKCESVLLFEKLRPAWQAGLLNGVGSKVEPGESIHQAMYREAWEEADVRVDGWTHFVTLLYPLAEIAFFTARGDEEFRWARAMTDEPLVRMFVRDVGLAGIVTNLAFLVPMARHAALFEKMLPQSIFMSGHAEALAARGADCAGKSR